MSAMLVFAFVVKIVFVGDHVHVSFRVLGSVGASIYSVLGVALAWVWVCACV